MLKVSLNINTAKFSSALGAKAQVIKNRQLVLSQNVARDMEAAIKESLNIPVERKDGKTLRSTPGNPPRRQTGRLRDSIETRVEVSANTANTSNTVRLIAGDLNGKAPYALYLEYGSSYLLARPFLLPALSTYGQLLAGGLKTIGEDL